MCRLSWNLGASSFWNHQGLSRPVIRLLYLLTLPLPFCFRRAVPTEKENAWCGGRILAAPQPLDSFVFGIEVSPNVFLSQSVSLHRHLWEFHIPYPRSCWGSILVYSVSSRSHWPRVLRRGSAAACLLGLRFRIPTGAWIFSLLNVVCCQIGVSATGRSLVQRSPTDCGVSECDQVQQEPSAPTMS